MTRSTECRFHHFLGAHEYKKFGEDMFSSITFINPFLIFTIQATLFAYPLDSHICFIINLNHTHLGLAL